MRSTNSMISHPPPMKAARISMIRFFLRSAKNVPRVDHMLMPSSLLEMLPLVLHSLHQLLEARLGADAGEPGVFFRKQWIVDKSAVNGVFEPSQRFLFGARESHDAGKDLGIRRIPL